MTSIHVIFLFSIITFLTFTSQGLAQEQNTAEDSAGNTESSQPAKTKTKKSAPKIKEIKPPDGSAPTARPPKNNPTSGSESKDPVNTIIEINDNSVEDSNEASTKPIDRLFRNPVFANGLASGADAINHSIDSLMESLFYNLVDNKLNYPLTGSASLQMGLTRDVFNARSGAYVVVDRFGIGPQYNRELYRYNDVPVILGAYQSSDVYDIYLRTDPMRVTENKKLPFWRVAVNNWFGILPILEAVLPPSFNANELYDPLNRFEVPFTFPLSIEALETMEIGSIKSYSISGGINLGIEAGEGIHGYKDQIMTGHNALDVKIPFTVFRTGEYRVNVLKKDANTVWVGAMDNNRQGQRVETKLGKIYYLLSKTIPLWKGMPAPIFPIDFALEEAIGDLFGRVYSFDLRNEEAKTAYLEAVHGNFAAAQISHLRAREDKIQTGVKFFYTKKERRFETAISTGHNVFVTNKRTRRTHSDAEIEITDNKGKFYILEAKEDSDLDRWDMLTGRSESNITLLASLLVRKVVEKVDSETELKSRYEFLAEGNPIEVAFSLSLKDKFVETEDLADYLTQLSRFTQLTLDGLPQFATREPEQLAQRRMEVFLDNDAKPKTRLHVTPTHLGQFEGYASIQMSNEQILAIASLPSERLWLGFCKAFKVEDPKTCLLWEKSIFWRNIYRTGRILSLPLRLVDYRWARADTVEEIESAVAALKRFAKENTPEQKQAALRSFFATEYPIERVEGLLYLTNLDEIPRSVELETKPKGNASEDVKNRFRSINGHRFTSDKPFPPPMRYDSTRAIESQFDPANLTFYGVKPRVKKISLFQEIPDDAKEEQAIDVHPVLATKLSVSKIANTPQVQVYVKLEQAGRVNLAKLKLIEDVVEIPIIPNDDGTLLDQANMLIKLSGPQSVLATLVSEESLNFGGEYKLTLAVSANGKLWSDEKTLEFRVEDGNLKAK